MVLIKSPKGVGKEIPLDDSGMRILCIGYDLPLQATRCAVLRQCGYYAEAVTPADAARVMGTGRYDLIILPTALSNYDEFRVFARLPESPNVLQIDNFSSPYELLHKVGKRLRWLSGTDPDAGE
jgi:CheY-like chemotaxis protein